MKTKLKTRTYMVTEDTRIILNKELIRTKRRALRLTQEDLAELVNISERHMRAIEREDIDAHIPLLYRLSQALAVSMEELILVISIAD